MFPVKSSLAPEGATVAFSLTEHLGFAGLENARSIKLRSSIIALWIIRKALRYGRSATFWMDMP